MTNVPEVPLPRRVALAQSLMAEGWSQEDADATAASAEPIYEGDEIVGFVLPDGRKTEATA